MPRGPGRRQRRVLAALEKAGGRLTRAELEDALGVEGRFDESNTLRAIRGLVREGLVVLDDRLDKTEATVSLPPPMKRLADQEIAELLEEVTEEGEKVGTRSRKTSDGGLAEVVRGPQRKTSVGGLEEAVPLRGPR